MNGEERRQYVREVVHALVGREPEEYRMSVAEFGVLQGWMDRGVPLAHVLQAIEQIQFERFPASVDYPFRGFRNPLLYIKPAVEAEHERANRAANSVA
jgi:hypothetical protein